MASDPLFDAEVGVCYLGGKGHEQMMLWVGVLMSLQFLILIQLCSGSRSPCSASSGTVRF